MPVVRQVRSRKPVEMEARLLRRIQETSDTWTLVFEVMGPQEYQAGQFLSIDPHQFAELAQLTKFLEHAKGKKEPTRAYSLSSAPHEGHVAITLKEEFFVPGQTQYPPLLTPLLAHGLQPGSTLRVQGFTGAYVLPQDADQLPEHAVHVVAGSGVVPSYSIVKDSLHRGLPVRHTFIYSNKTWADVCFREELAALERAHPDKLKVVHTLTRENDVAQFGSSVCKGRICLEQLQALIPDPATCLVFVCGPAISPWDRRAAMEKGESATPKFLETVIGHLTTLGIERHRLKRESWG
ncbi:MAG TPA: oxidoreductase [Myxococcaceae bacterium]|nr:oxidoreductase [Myxococcaceae bacterium]